jgi:hypothetical protein
MKRGMTILLGLLVAAVVFVFADLNRLMPLPSLLAPPAPPPIDGITAGKGFLLCDSEPALIEAFNAADAGRYADFAKQPCWLVGEHERVNVIRYNFLVAKVNWEGSAAYGRTADLLRDGKPLRGK